MEAYGDLARDLDEVSAEWVSALTGTGPVREAGYARLHDLLVRAAVHEMRRREARSGIAGPELHDLAYQAAADAMVAILAKLGTFRGESRFTTWAYRFVVLEVSGMRRTLNRRGCRFALRRRQPAAYPPVLARAGS